MIVPQPHGDLIMTTELDDPFERLENAAKRKEIEEKAAALLAKARTKLVLGVRGNKGDPKAAQQKATFTFLATLALKLKPVVDWDSPTGWTDGKHLGYNPEWLASLDLERAKFFVAHEVLHNALNYFGRLGHRHPQKANVAHDLVINPIARDAGLTPIEGGLFPGKRPMGNSMPAEWADAIVKLPEGLCFEEVYSRLPNVPGDGGDDGDGDGQGGLGDDPGGCGSVRKAGDGSQAAQRQAEADWKVAVAQAAAAAKQRGTLPAGLDRLVTELLEPVVDWREVLREFISRQAKNDYSWRRPNRKALAQGFALPGTYSDELGDVVCFVDTSGSIGQAELNRFASEMEGILQAYDCTLTIAYHDVEVAGVERWSPADGPLTLSPKGGGGTSHVPAFAWLAEQPDLPACVVCLTDMYTEFPDDGPDCPVLWARIGSCDAKPPFGVVLDVNLK
jgi:predicted metal-dependent peptidase